LVAAKVNEGIALLNLQQIEQARQILLEAVKTDPGNARAWYNLGLLYRGDNQPKAALDAFQHASELEPKDADSHYFLGTVYMQLKEFPQAISEFQKTLIWTRTMPPPSLAWPGLTSNRGTWRRRECAWPSSSKSRSRSWERP